MTTNSLYNKLRRLPKDRKGIGTVFGMVFFILIVMVVFASFIIVLNQNTGLEQTTIQTRQMDLDKANEQITITPLATSNLYTNIGSNSLTLVCNLTNTGTLPVQVVRLWVEDLSNSQEGNLAILNPNVIIQQGYFWECNQTVTIQGIQSNDTIIFWFVTSRGNQFTLQPSSQGAGSGGAGTQNYYQTIINQSVNQDLSSVFGQYLPIYNSVQWATVTKQGNNYVAGPWTSGWIIPTGSNNSNIAFRFNMTYYGNSTMKIDQNSNLWLNNYPGSIYDTDTEDELPLLYISNYTASTGVLSLYPGHEMTVLPSANGTAVTLYFASLQPSDYQGNPINTQIPSGYELEDIEPTVMMTTTIYGKSPSTYAQSFLLYAIQSRVIAVSLNPTSGTTGTSVTVNGVGFAANSAISLAYDSSPLTIQPTTTNNIGNFAVSFTVPPSTSGSHTITATDNSLSQNTAIATFTVIPLITLSTHQGPAGTPIAMTGTGFAANSTVAFTLGGNAMTTIPANIMTDATGSFSATCIVPISTAGANNVVVTDAMGNYDTDTFTVTIPSISLNPTSAQVGATVTVTGSNFVPSSAITILFDGNGVTTTTSTATGALPSGVTFVLPASTAGIHIVTCTDASSNSATASLTMTPITTLNPTTGPSGTQVTIIGKGFAASAKISVTFGGTSVTTSPSSVMTDNWGSFTCSFIVPSTTAGAKTVQSTDGTNSDSETFTLVTRTLNLNPTSGPNGTAVTVTGTNFVPNTAITLNFDSTIISTSPASLTSSGTGSFSCTLVAPNSSTGIHTIYASDTITNAASATFTIAASSISVSPSSGSVGSIVTLTGSNFLPNSLLTVTYNGATIATATSSSTGMVPSGVTFTVPAATYGSVNSVIVTDANGNYATATFTVSTATISVSPTSGIIGSSATLSGQGFSASSTITLTFNSNSVPTSPSTITTNSSGSFTASFNVPFSSTGAKTVQATDINSHTASTTFSVTPSSISLSPTSGPSGTSITVTGSSFTPNSAITVKFAGTAVTTNPSSITTSGTGSFSATFTVPTGALSGGQTVAATDSASNSGTATFTVTIPTITLSPSSGQVSTSVTVSGSNYLPNSALTIKYDGNLVATSTSTGSGAIPSSVTFSVPSSVAGSNTVLATDGVNTVSATFTVAPTITLSPTTGTPGTTVTVSGSGFGASKVFTATFAGFGVTLSGTTTTNATGSFSGATFTAPSTTSGAKTVIITDSSSNAASATFTLKAPFGMDGIISQGSSSHGLPTLTLSTTQTNDVIILMVTQDYSHTFSPSDTAGLSWTLRGSRQSSDTNEETYEYWAIASSPLTSDVISLGESGNNGHSYDTAAIAYAISGANTANPFDSNSGLPYTNRGTSGTPTVTGISTSNPNDMIIGLVGYKGTPTGETAAIGYSLIASQTSGSSQQWGAAEYQKVSSNLSGATLSWGTSISSNDWTMIVDAIQQGP